MSVYFYPRVGIRTSYDPFADPNVLRPKKKIVTVEAIPNLLEHYKHEVFLESEACTKEYFQACKKDHRSLETIAKAFLKLKTQRKQSALNTLVISPSTAVISPLREDDLGKTTSQKPRRY